MILLYKTSYDRIKPKEDPIMEDFTLFRFDIHFLLCSVFREALVS